ncbi:MAG TPA: hypothetical protein VHN98_01225 [Acidimicrobiales bacterium]|nr:hypothetical protein [Acidimicrobiales bacterium]
MLRRRRAAARPRRRLRRLALLSVLAGAGYAVRQRKLTENQQRFGLP